MTGPPGHPGSCWSPTSIEGIRTERRSAPAFADIDGDGDQDLLIGSEAGPLRLYRNTGTRTEPHFSADAAFQVKLPPLSAPAFADIDGDGDPDLFAGNVSGGVVFYQNTGR